MLSQDVQNRENFMTADSEEPRVRVEFMTVNGRANAMLCSCILTLRKPLFCLSSLVVCNWHPSDLKQAQIKPAERRVVGSKTTRVWFKKVFMVTIAIGGSHITATSAKRVTNTKYQSAILVFLCIFVSKLVP